MPLASLSLFQYCHILFCSETDRQKRIVSSIYDTSYMELNSVHVISVSYCFTFLHSHVLLFQLVS